MPVLFGFAAIIAIVATIMALTRLNAVHALLYLVPSLLAVAVALYALGAPYLAALEVIIYAGAIMVLFVFVTMMLNLGAAAVRQEKAWQPGRAWIGPGILAALLLAELLWMLIRGAHAMPTVNRVGPEAVGQSLLTTYVVGVELASMLLMAAVIAAYHLGYGLVKKQDHPTAAIVGAGPSAATPRAPLTRRPGRGPHEPQSSLRAATASSSEAPQPASHSPLPTFHLSPPTSHFPPPTASRSSDRSGGGQ